MEFIGTLLKSRFWVKVQLYLLITPIEVLVTLLTKSHDPPSGQKERGRGFRFGSGALEFPDISCLGPRNLNIWGLGLGFRA